MSLDELVEGIAERAATKALAGAAEALKDEDVPVLLTREAIAKKIGISAPTVARLIREGMPTLVITPECLRFELEAVLAWLRTRGK